MLTTNSTSLECHDHKWMDLALAAAQTAAEDGEVPVGAVLIHDQTLIAKAYNQPIGLNDPTAHAEILALRAAAQHFGNYRLPGTTLYVTLEPCIMCIGAILLARIDRLVYGATDPKTGAVQSLYQIAENPRGNHRLQVTGGVRQEECGSILRSFFQKKRRSAAREVQMKT